MTDEEDEDALLARLEKSLAAIRRDADLVRAGGAADLASSVARTEVELRRLVAAFDALLIALGQQQKAIAQIGTAVARGEEERLELRQILEELAATDRDPSAEGEPLPPPPPAWQESRPVGLRAATMLLVLVLMLGSAAAGWLAASRRPALETLFRQTASQVSALIGIDLLTHPAPAAPPRTNAQAAPPPMPPAAAAPAPVASSQTPDASPQTPDASPPAPVASPAVPTTPQPPETTQPQAAGAPLPSSTPPEKPSAAAPAPPTPPQAAAPAAVAAPSPAATPPSTPTEGQTAAPPVTPTSTEASSQAPAQPTSESTSPAVMVPAASQPPAPSSAPAHFVLRATADTWVWVRPKDGPTLLSRILKTGETWSAPDESGLLLDTGHAGGLVLEVDGIPTRLSTTKGDIVRGIVLDNHLLQSGLVHPIRGTGSSPTAPHGPAAR